LYEFEKLNFINAKYNFFCHSTFLFPVSYAVSIMDRHFQPDLLLSPPTALNSAHGTKVIEVGVKWMTVWMTVVFNTVRLKYFPHNMGMTLVTERTKIVSRHFENFVIYQKYKK